MIWSAKTIIKSFRKHLRDIYDIFEEGNSFYNTKKENSYIDSIFPACKNISIDYGVMEKSDAVYVFPADLGWSDLGTWSSLYTYLDLDKNHTAVQGNNVFLYEPFFFVSGARLFLGPRGAQVPETCFAW